MDSCWLNCKSTLLCMLHIVHPAMFPEHLSTLEFQSIRELVIWVLIQTFIPIKIRFKLRQCFLVLKILKCPSRLEFWKFQSSYWLHFLINALSHDILFILFDLTLNFSGGLGQIWIELWTETPLTNKMPPIGVILLVTPLKDVSPNYLICQ